MTRELLFITNFESQFATSTGWHSLATTVGATPTSNLAASDFPGFLAIPGETSYTSFDSAGHPITGVQAFALRVYFQHAQLMLSNMRTSRSDYIGTIEAFFAGIYTPPSVSTGDPARIDSVILEKIEPGSLNKSETRSVITVQALCHFTLL